MIALAAKPQTAVLSYRIDAPTTDTVASAVVTPTGVTVDSETQDATGVTLVLSGGVIGEIAIVQVTFTTTTGLTVVESAALPIIDSSSAQLAAFRVQFPELSGLDDGTVSFWLNAAGDHEHWPEACRDEAILLYAAHRASETSETGSPKGVTQFRSGTFSASFSDSVSERTEFEASIYGRRYLELMRVGFSGPRLAWVPSGVC